MSTYYLFVLNLTFTNTIYFILVLRTEDTGEFFGKGKSQQQDTNSETEVYLGHWLAILWPHTSASGMQASVPGKLQSHCLCLAVDSCPSQKILPCLCPIFCFPISRSPVLLFSHSPVLPFSCSPILLFSHSPILLSSSSHFSILHLPIPMFTH
ncbi:uncharacterized protein EDB91DRAFT_1263353, partial [Suillus paluster]|uniref:uncharacterized protein n=1 Tax=Suillus paluster TaxID=48578 RepID=UPI001B876CE7